MAHGGGHDGDLRIATHLVGDRVASVVREGRLFTDAQHAWAAILVLEGRRCVEVNGVFFRRFVAAAFLGDDVEQGRSLLVANHLQVFAHQPNIMPIDRSDVAETELFEEHAADHPRLNPFFDLREQSLGRITKDGKLVEDLDHLALESRVERIGSESVQVVGQCADARADRHLVIVEHDDQVFVQFTGVVQRFEDDARWKRAIADDSDALAVALVHQVIARLESEGSGYGTTGVPGHEQIVLALVWVGVSHEPTPLSDGFELSVATSDQFVRIDLVARIPDQSVFAKVEDAVEGQAEFDHT